ncbi:hypothetical protein BUALT_Bualt07G0146000 [Buddleja alternifolia]|uniref:Protein kinase A anchor protein nuclear localisation signal domain-containing protein n=1 Tax=Buddleja alternifolia TaxID=168488 RepID=A0AAV6XLP3_9LAMI|nr:hypothetical protein BUALT_Bualt07G0146000 [Buddleja alternifolia]
MFVFQQGVNSQCFDYSHFISIPLAIDPGLVDKLVNFQDRILGTLGKNTVSGIEESIFINPKTFHLTVLMLKLWNEERVKAAEEVLKNVSSKVIAALENRPVMIRLKGLDCMKGSFVKARVLYAPVEEITGEGRLLRACQVITDAFIEAGLVMEKDAQHKLKLHATLMNVRFRKRKNKTGDQLDSFDARGIFDQYGSEEWGEYRVCEAHLSQMHAFDENGYYHCCASIPFPDHMRKVERRPQSGCVKVTFAWAIDKNHGCSSVGFIARDHKGSCIAWSSRRFEYVMAQEHVEAMGAKLALEMAVKAGWENVIVEGEFRNLESVLELPRLANTALPFDMLGLK